MRDKYPDAGQGAVCDSVFALHAQVHSSISVLQAPRHQPPNQWILGCRCLVVSGAAMSLATESMEAGIEQPLVSVSVSAATGSAAHPPSTQSDGQKVRTKPSRPDTLKKARNPRVLKNVTVAERVVKFGMYSLYDNNGKLYCKPCGKKMDETREDSLTKNVTSGFHDVACAKHTHASAKFALVPGYEQREESRQSKERAGGAIRTLTLFFLLWHPLSDGGEIPDPKVP